VPNWTEDGFYNSPDLSSVGQEVVDRGGWSSNNSMAFLITGDSGHIRRAFSWDGSISWWGDGSGAATLHIEYEVPATPCTANRTILADEWESFSLPCDPGSSNTVEEIFSDLDSGQYDTIWVVWRFDASDSTYYKMAPTDPIYPGHGYWIYHLQTDPPVVVDYVGVENMTGDLALETDASAGALNFIGYTKQGAQKWSNFDAANGARLDKIPAADPSNACDIPTGQCLVASTAYMWESNNWATLDANVPAYDNDVLVSYPLFVTAYKPSTMLRISDPPPSPALPMSVTKATVSQAESVVSASRESALKRDRKKNASKSWFVRLIAESGSMRDYSNALGQLEQSVDGLDGNDLEEWAPFGNKYISLIFENDAFPDSSWGYTSDYRAMTKQEDSDSPGQELHLHEQWWREPLYFYRSG